MFIYVYIYTHCTYKLKGGCKVERDKEEKNGATVIV